jgi:hypothetical protein
MVYLWRAVDARRFNFQSKVAALKLMRNPPKKYGLVLERITTDNTGLSRRSSVRRDFGGERNVPNPRYNPALFRPVSGSAIGDPTGARGDRQIAPPAGIKP